MFILLANLQRKRACDFSQHSSLFFGEYCHEPTLGMTQQTQNICITCIQRRLIVDPTLYKSRLTGPSNNY